MSPKAAEIGLAARKQRLDPLLLQQEVVSARPQRGELRIRNHGLQAHQRLILLDDLSLFHQDLLDDASLEMLHRTNLGYRDELTARERELADGSHCGPHQRTGGQHDDQPHPVAGDTKAPLFLELDRGRQPIGRLG